MATLNQINIGSVADDDTGDPLRSAFDKSNQSDTAINAELVALLTASGLVSGAVNLGTFTGSIISDNTDLLTALQELESAIGVTAYSTVGDLPAPSTVTSGTIAAVVDDGVNSGLYLAIGTLASPASSWVKA